MQFSTSYFMIIPFFIPHSGCPHQCIFCNQKNITGLYKSIEPASLSREIEEYLKTRTAAEPAQIAFYGGTFTALPHDLQKAYLEAVEPFIRSGTIRSIRLSTRPDCISTEILTILKQRHVETVELGVQSMNDDVLTMSGRGHTASDTVNAVKLLKEQGFEIGMQLMPGLPGDSSKRFMETVERTILLGPNFVRLYPALVIKETPLEKLHGTGSYRPLSLDEAVDLCKKALMRFETARIDVIRIGLQPTEELEKPGTILAGPYHPAFRQLVESSILLDRMTSALSAGKRSPDRALFLVNPGDVSNAIGQKRSNIQILKKQFGLNNVLVQPSDTVPRRNVRLVESPEG